MLPNTTQTSVTPGANYYYGITKIFHLSTVLSRNLEFSPTRSKLPTFLRLKKFLVLVCYQIVKNVVNILSIYKSHEDVLQA